MSGFFRTAADKRLDKFLGTFRSGFHDIKNAIEGITKQHEAAEAQTRPPQEVIGVIDQPSSVKAENQSYRTGQRRRDRWRLVVEWATLAAVVFYGCITYRMFRQMKQQTSDLETNAANARTEAALQLTQLQRQANAVERQMREDQRPWIRFDFGDPKNPDAKITWAIKVGAPIYVPVRFTNIGKTAALDVHSDIVITIVKNGSDPVLPQHFGTATEAKLHGGHAIASIDLGSSVLFPDSHINDMAPRVEIAQGKVQSQPLSKEEFDDFAADKRHLRVFGEVRYDDVFGIHHWTRFCKETLINGTENSTVNCAKYAAVDNNY